jgi:hypothetical protein
LTPGTRLALSGGNDTGRDREMERKQTTRRPVAKAIAIRPADLFPLTMLALFYGLFLLQKLG